MVASPDSDSSSEAEEMSDEQAKKKIEEDSKEFFAVRSIEEATDYFVKLPPVHHTKLVDKFVSMSLESKEADAQLVADFFSMASSKNLCSIDAFEEAFIALTEFLDDIAIDAPKAPKLMAIMLRGPSFSDEQREKIAAKSAENGEAILDA
jgi:translation initiation factor 4G